jgi:hypothetical protein
VQAFPLLPYIVSDAHSANLRSHRAIGGPRLKSFQATALHVALVLLLFELGQHRPVSLLWGILGSIKPVL